MSYLPVYTIQRRNWRRVEKHAPEVEDSRLSVEPRVHAEAQGRELSRPERKARVGVVVPKLRDSFAQRGHEGVIYESHLNPELKYMQAGRWRVYRMGENYTPNVAHLLTHANEDERPQLS